MPSIEERIFDTNNDDMDFILRELYSICGSQHVPVLDEPPEFEDYNNPPPVLFLTKFAPIKNIDLQFMVDIKFKISKKSEFIVIRCMKDNKSYTCIANRALVFDNDASQVYKNIWGIYDPHYFTHPATSNSTPNYVCIKSKDIKELLGQFPTEQQALAYLQSLPANNECPVVVSYRDYRNKMC